MYASEEVTDEGLTGILAQFQTMYPYLERIAHANAIADPFDDRVVEAYWVGNSLLENVGKRGLHDHIVNTLRLKDKVRGSALQRLDEKIGHGAVPHHSFHVLDVWRETGHNDRELTLESMDECRVSWGRVQTVDGPFVTVVREPLLYENGKLRLGEPVPKRLVRQLESEYDIEQIAAGDIVTMHWSVICESVSERKAESLKRYTLKHIALANETI